MVEEFREPRLQASSSRGEAQLFGERGRDAGWWECFAWSNFFWPESLVLIVQCQKLI